MSRRRPTALAVGLAVLVLTPAAVQAAPRGAASPAPPAAGQPVPGEVLVGFQRGASGSERAAARRSADVTVKRALTVPGVQLVKTAPGESIGDTVARLERDPNVRYAEPNRWRTASSTVPNDPLFDQLWGLDNTGVLGGTADADIDAPEAWDVFTGGDTVVAVVDEGVTYDHPDLAPNMWTNAGEIAGNGVDDDGNGYVDDVHGTDVIDRDNDPRDFGGHGTHVAGTIAAAGYDGLGVAGVSWSARIMAVRALGPGGGSDADIAEAFEYAADNGARVVNASLGGPGGTTDQLETLRAPILAHPETLFVVAAGNSHTNNDPIRGSSEYPCSFPDANLICVAATDQNDVLASFSNFGSTSVDLAAPGVGILSDRPFVGMTEDFEVRDFAGRWDAHVDTSTATRWARTTAGPSSGSFAITDSPGGNYTDNGKTYADLLTPVDLRAATGCVLTFRARYALAPGDRFVVDRTLNDWLDASRIDAVEGTSNGTYEQFSLPLAADGQRTVSFGFGLESNLTGTDDGVTVDDVAVRCANPTPDMPVFALNSGTSMATPHVAGAAALLLGRKPSMSVEQLRSALLTTGDEIPSLDGKTVTGRRLNLNNAAGSAEALAPLPAPTATTRPASSVSLGEAALNGVFNARGSATSWQFEYGPTTAYGSATTLTAGVPVSRNVPVSAPIGGLSPDTTYHFRVVAIRGADRFPGPDATFKTAAPAVVVPPPTSSLAKRVKGARVACTRKRGKYRCRVSLTRASGMKVRLVLKRGKKVVGRAHGRVGKRITLKGRKAKAGRYKVTLTFTEGTKKASITKRLRVR